MNKALFDIVNKFNLISLDEMNSVALMKRTDTKYIINISLLTKVLEKLSESYRILEIKEKRIRDYRFIKKIFSKKNFEARVSR